LHTEIIKQTRIMNHYIITYSYPEKYRGTYHIEGKDGLDASDKLQKYLRETRGDTKDSHSIVLEVVGNTIQLIG